MTTSKQREGSPGLAATGRVLGAMVVPGALGVSTVSVVLPALSADLALSHPQGAWVLAAYVLAQAMFVAVFGRLADVRGVRVVLAQGAALTAAGSLLAAGSLGFASLIAGRLLQGAGAGALWVAAFAIVAARYSGRDRAQVIGLVTACLGIISGAGSLIGGILADGLSWRVVIAIPVLSLVATVPAARLVSAVDGAPRRMDGTGAALVAVLASALIVLLQAPSTELPGWVVAGMALVAFSAASVIVRRVRTVPEGFVPAAVIRSRRFVLGALAALTLFASYLGLVFAAPLLILQDHDWSPTRIGLLLAPAAVMGALAARMAGRLIATRDPFRLASACAVLCSLGLLMAGAADGSPAATALAMGLVLTGFSAGQVALVANVPLTVAAEARSVATGLYTLAFMLGGAIGSATVAGLTDPFGLSGAVACVAALPAGGALLALGAGAARVVSPEVSDAGRRVACAP